MNSTGVIGTPRDGPDGVGPAAVEGAGAEAEEVVTPLLCPLRSHQVQRMFPTCKVKQNFTMIGEPC